MERVDGSDRERSVSARETADARIPAKAGGPRRRRRPGRLIADRYIAREILGPTVLGFVTYTFFLLLRVVFSLSEQVFVHGLSGGEALRILGASIPHVVVLTIPMSFLFGVLVSLGRMNSDNEIIALQAGGVSLWRIVMPVLMVGLVLAAGNAAITLRIIPKANRNLAELKARYLQRGTGLGQIEARVFHDEFPNVLLYVRDIDRSSGYWKNVLLFDQSVAGAERLVVARRGRLVAGNAREVAARAASDGRKSAPGTSSPTPSGAAPGRSERTTEGSGGDDTDSGSPWLLLEDVVTHQFNPRKPEAYKRDRNRIQLVRLFPPEPSGARATFSLGERERTTRQLLQEIRTPSNGSPEQARKRRYAAVELHKRLAIPIACLVFALIGLPLGIGSRSATRGRGFVLSIGLIMVYYVILNHGELLSREGRIPAWLGPWLPNLVLVLIAFPLMTRMGRWLGEHRRGHGAIAVLSERIRHGFRTLRARLPQRSTAPRHEATGKIPVVLKGERRVNRFPTLLDRYLLGRLLVPLVGVLATTVGLYVIVDISDKIDEIAKHHASLGVFLAYYINFIPQVILDVGPLAVLIAVLVLLTLLEQRLELTILKASGISIYRVTVPVVLLAGVFGLLLFGLEETVVPTANRQARQYLSIIKGRSPSRAYSSTERQWLFSRDGTALYNFLSFDRRDHALIGLTEYRLDLTDFRLSQVMYAERVRFENGSWIAVKGWVRTIRPDGSDLFRRIKEPQEVSIAESPTYFAHEYRSPRELRFRELQHYITRLAESGYRPTRLLVQLQQKITYPLSALVMVLIGLPYGLNRSGSRHATPVVGVGLAIMLGVAYFVIVAILGKMGEAGILPPVVAAWSPIVIALLFSINRFTTVRT